MIELNIYVREYSDNDYTAVNDILLESFGFNKIGHSNSSVHEFVAEKDGIVVGYFYLLDGFDIIEDKKNYFLEYFCVGSNYRGLGISNYMIDFIFEFAKKNNIDYIELTSNNHRLVAHSLYKKHGFIVRDTTVFRKEIL